MRSPYLRLGRAVRVWGLDGGVKVEPSTDSLTPLTGLAAIYVGMADASLQQYEVEWVRQSGSSWVVRLRGVESPEQAARVVGHELFIPRSAAPPLPEGTYYHADLVGLRVRTEEGRELGQIVEIWETGANDVYVVQGQNGEWLLPATREVVRMVDLAGEVMLVRPLEGMIESEAV